MTTTHRAHAARRPRSRSRPLPIIPVAIGVVALAAAFAVAVTVGTDDAGSNRRETATIAIRGATLPSYATPSDPAVGAVAPELDGVDFDGADASVRHDGKPTAIVFMAHWCGHCRNEVPAVRSWIERNGAPAGVDLMTVVTMTDARRPNYPPSAWLEDEAWPLPVIVDDAASSAAAAFGLTGTPFWVFLDGEGRVESRHAGEIGIPELERRLAALTA